VVRPSNHLCAFSAHGPVCLKRCAAGVKRGPTLARLLPSFSFPFLHHLPAVPYELDSSQIESGTDRSDLFFASLPTKIDPYIRPLSPRVISTKSSTQTRRSSLATEAFRRQRNPQAVKLSRPARVVASRSCLLARVDACRSRLRRRLSTAGG
jgi:hypothetical protein